MNGWVVFPVRCGSGVLGKTNADLAAPAILWEDLYVEVSVQVVRAGIGASFEQPTDEDVRRLASARGVIPGPVRHFAGAMQEHGHLAAAAHECVRECGGGPGWVGGS